MLKMHKNALQLQMRRQTAQHGSRRRPEEAVSRHGRSVEREGRKEEGGKERGRGMRKELALVTYILPANKGRLDEPCLRVSKTTPKFTTHECTARESG